MAIRSGFFNSVNGDRKYDAKFFAEYFASFIGNGVFPNPSNGLQIVEGSTMQTIMKHGKGWINGWFVENDSDYVFQHDISDGVLNRIDRIVMRLDHTIRDIVFIVKKGTNASNPVPPSLQRDADAYELALADVYIGRGTTQITRANITDLRFNKDLCGIVHGTVEQVDTTTLFNQYQSWIQQQKEHYENDFESWSNDKRQEFELWKDVEKADFQSWKTLEQSEFEAWVQTIKDILNENAAGNLQLQIDDHKADDVDHVKYAVDTGTANAKVVSINPPPESYKDGMAIAFKNKEQNTGPTTINVNGLGEVPIVKSNGQPLTPDYLLPNSIYTIRFNADTGNFIFQGEGGGLYGNVTPDDVLAGVIFGTDEGEKIGSMPNNGAVIITPGQNDQIIPYGFHNGQGKVPKVEFDASRVLTGTTIAGKQGTMPNRGAMVITPSTINQTIPLGYHNGNGYVMGDPDLKPSNILNGVNIFGVVGNVTLASLGGVKYASGTGISIPANSNIKFYRRDDTNGSLSEVNYQYIQVSGLTFKPKKIIVEFDFSSSAEYSDSFGDMYDIITVARNGDALRSRYYKIGLSAYVNETGFLIPAPTGNQRFTWHAYG